MLLQLEEEWYFFPVLDTQTIVPTFWPEPPEEPEELEVLAAGCGLRL